MADNVTLPGTGDVIAADDAGAGGKVQLFKLAVSTDGSVTLIPADATNGLTIGGNVAHGSGDAGSPVKIGAKVETSLAAATMEADGDRTNLMADADGGLVVKPYTVNGDILVERVSDTGGTSTASTVFGATASARNCLTTIVVYNDSTTNGYIDFRDGTAGTIILTLPLPAKGGAIFNPSLPLRQPTANTAFAYDVSAALTTVYISLIGFKSKA